MHSTDSIFSWPICKTCHFQRKQINNFVLQRRKRKVICGFGNIADLKIGKFGSSRKLVCAMKSGREMVEQLKWLKIMVVWFAVVCPKIFGSPTKSNRHTDIHTPVTKKPKENCQRKWCSCLACNFLGDMALCIWAFSWGFLCGSGTDLVFCQKNISQVLSTANVVGTLLRYLQPNTFSFFFLLFISRDFSFENKMKLSTKVQKKDIYI